jgi:hypothetical protein
MDCSAIGKHRIYRGVYIKQSKAVPLHAMEAFGGEEV